MCTILSCRYSCGHRRTIAARCRRHGESAVAARLSFVPHRVERHRVRSSDVCRACAAERAATEALARRRHEERAKHLMEYFRGEHATPWIPQDEAHYRARMAARRFALGDTLLKTRAHLFTQTTREHTVSYWQARLLEDVMTADPYYTAGAEELYEMFLEMSRREEDITRTGRAITDEDRQFSLLRIIELRRRALDPREATPMTLEEFIEETSNGEPDYEAYLTSNPSWWWMLTWFRRYRHLLSEDGSNGSDNGYETAPESPGTTPEMPPERAPETVHVTRRTIRNSLERINDLLNRDPPPYLQDSEEFQQARRDLDRFMRQGFDYLDRGLEPGLRGLEPTMIQTGIQVLEIAAQDLLDAIRNVRPD